MIIFIFFTMLASPLSAMAPEPLPSCLKCQDIDDIPYLYTWMVKKLHDQQPRSMSLIYEMRTLEVNSAVSSNTMFNMSFLISDICRGKRNGILRLPFNGDNFEVVEALPIGSLRQPDDHFFKSSQFIIKLIKNKWKISTLMLNAALPRQEDVQEWYIFRKTNNLKRYGIIPIVPDDKMQAILIKDIVGQLGLDDSKITVGNDLRKNSLYIRIKKSAFEEVQAKLKLVIEE